MNKDTVLLCTVSFLCAIMAIIEVISAENGEKCMFERNTRQVNRIIARIFAFGSIAILILVLCSCLGIFEFGKNYTLIVLIAGLIISLSPSILIRVLSPDVMKNYMLIALAVFIGVLGTNNHIGIYITYALVPIFSCLYFDPKLILRTSVFSYLVMAAAVYVNSAEKYEVVNMGMSRTSLFIAYMIGFTIEYIIVGSILYSLVKRAKRMMDERYSAEEENRMKSRFLSSMSHEIRTPMNAIIGMTDVALRKDMDEDVRKCLTVIRSSSMGLLDIINDILDLSKIEAGKSTIVEEAYETQALIDDMTAIVNARNSGKKVPVFYHIQKDMPQVLKGDALRIKQVMLNYASNAIKYTESGRIDISLGCEELEDGNVMLTYSVEDTGQGIRKSDMNKLFQMYTRLNEEQNHGKEGTGIGLAISKQYVEAMKGTVGVRSEYGVGSTFYFKIPQEVVPVSVPDTVSVTDTASGNSMDGRNSRENSGESGCKNIGESRSRNTGESRGRNTGENRGEYLFTTTDARILLVDDNEINREVMKAILEPLKLEIDEAQDGQEAVDMACAKLYDMIFMDSHMPVMNGEEATKHIREDSGCINQKTPIIAVTADAIHGVRERLIGGGMNDYIVKPIDVELLFNVVRKYLPKSKILE